MRSRDDANPTAVRCGRPHCHLAQTVLGVVVLSWCLSDTVDLTRTMIAVWIVGVWAWRCATYRTIQPLRRRPSTS